jgi:hypothetical protein
VHDNGLADPAEAMAGNLRQIPEFYHFKLELATWCQFFDNMLSSGMKESQHNRIQFPDQDPDAWPFVYKCLSLQDQKELQNQFYAYLKSNNIRGICDEKNFALLQWFDFLGRDDLAKVWDTIYAQQFEAYFESNPTLFPHPSCWSNMKNLPCPQLQEILKTQVKNSIGLMIRHPQTFREKLKLLPSYLLDDECGDELWGYLISQGKFSDAMLQDLDRAAIVTSPTFIYMFDA